MRLDIFCFSFFIFFFQVIGNQKTCLAKNDYYKFRSIILLAPPDESIDSANYKYQIPLRKYFDGKCFTELYTFFKNGNYFNIPLQVQKLKYFEGPYGKNKKNGGYNRNFYHYTVKFKDGSSSTGIPAEYPYLVTDLTRNKFQAPRYNSSSEKMKGIYFDMRTWANNLCFGSNCFGFSDKSNPDLKTFSNNAGGMLYVASNPYSSSAFGDQMVTFTFNEKALIYTLISQNEFEKSIKFRNEYLKKKLPSCPIHKLSHLILEENKVDLVYYTNDQQWNDIGDILVKSSEAILPMKINENKKLFVGWFQILSVDHIENFTVQDMGGKEKKYYEINNIFTSANRSTEILESH